MTRLAAPFEGSRRPADEPPSFFLANRWRAGRKEDAWTDDTYLTVLEGEALLTGDGRVNPGGL